MLLAAETEVSKAEIGSNFIYTQPRTYTDILLSSSVRQVTCIQGHIPYNFGVIGELLARKRGGGGVEGIG
jgi:hypothetical protein